MVSPGSGRIHHLDLTVVELARSTAFYDGVLALLGFTRLADCAEGPLWGGAGLEIGLQAARVDGPVREHDRWTAGLHHLAFAANSPGEVDGVFDGLLGLGVTILDPPAAYPQYGPDYYALFFCDPDGIKLEVVFASA